MWWEVKMEIQESSKAKQPLSLKWKWGFLLFLSLWFISATSLIVYQQLTLNDFQSQMISRHQQNFEDLQAELANTQDKFNSQVFGYYLDPGEVSLQQRLVELFASEEVIIRIFDSHQNLVYESQNLDLPLEAAQPHLKEIEVEGQVYMIGNQRLLSTVNDQLLGSIQYIAKPDRMSDFYQDQKRYLLISSLVHLVLAAIMAGVLSIHFLKPLNYVNDTLDLMEGDTLSKVRVMKPRSNDEWSDLSLHVNKLLDKIDLYVRNQKQFVEDVSHELRTPVAIVEGHLKMLDRWGKEDKEILEESISASLQEITRMKVLVQEMLDLSRADHVDVDYKNEKTEIISAMRQIYNNFVMLYPDFDIYLDSEKDNQAIYVNMFRNHFEQILIILLDNAVKYSRDRKEIHISLSRGVGKVEIAVQDFGEGMKEEDKKRVFARFYRVDKARSRNQGGNGLGLSIAKQLVEGYKGRIRVESVYKHGSIFYIEFPIMEDVEED